MTGRRQILRAAAAAVLLASLPSTTHAEGPLPVVATFSILGDMVSRVGGEHVAVTTLVGPDGDAHVYQPTTGDARALAAARLLVVNGLAFEGWLDRLVDASGFEGARAVAAEGIEPLAFEEDDHGHGHGHKHGHGHGHGHDHGEFDPHAWQSVDNAAVYVRNIAAALSAVDPDNAADFQRNRDAYLAELAGLDAEIRALVAGLPADRRTVVTSHDAFRYFGDAYGLTFHAPQGISTEAEASARDVARLIEQIRAEGIPAVFVENISDGRLLERIAAETGASIGGTLYPDALSGPDGPAATYIDMMRHNARTLTAALAF